MCTIGELESAGCWVKNIFSRSIGVGLFMKNSLLAFIGFFSSYCRLTLKTIKISIDRSFGLFYILFYLRIDPEKAFLAPSCCLPKYMCSLSLNPLETTRIYSCLVSENFSGGIVSALRMKKSVGLG